MLQLLPNWILSLACPRCRIQREIEITKFIEIAKVRKFIYQCKCGYLFGVELERRRHERKAMDISGLCLTTGRILGGENPSVIINDLSKSGVRFTAEETIDAQVGDTIILTFYLNDSNQSRFTKQATIRHKRAQYLSAEFSTYCDHAVFSSFLIKDQQFI